MTVRYVLSLSLGVILCLITTAALQRDAQAVAFPEWDGFELGTWSNGLSWDPNVVPATGDYLKFGSKSSGGRITNDIANLSVTRLTFADRSYIIEGNPLNVSESIVVEQGSTTHSIELDISGVAATLVANGGALKLSGANTFSGQVDVFGTLDADSNGALGSIVGATRILPGGSMNFTERDLGLEPIRVSGVAPLASCAIVNGGGISVLRDIQIGSGPVCFANFSLGDGTLSYPNGIGQFADGFDLLLLGGRHRVGGLSSASGVVRVSGETDLVWDTMSPNLEIVFEPFLEFLPEGDLRGSGRADDLHFRGGGTFGAGTGNIPGKFILGSQLDIDESTFFAVLNSATAGTGYSQVQAGDFVYLGTDTELDLSVNFQPAVGTEFRLIDVLGEIPVTGAFAGLPEGETFELAGRRWQITYKGGTGNDVVLTRAADVVVDPLPYKRTLPMVTRS